jgi:hypothetical protein
MKVLRRLGESCQTKSRSAKGPNMNLELLKMRELHQRISDGIQIRMLWSEAEGRVIVSVVDGRTGASFTVDVHDGERALDVFHHPYAYAAYHGIDTSVSSGTGDTAELPLAA